MTGAVTFYAWTSPAFVSGSPVDHTWVTTYDNRINSYANESQVIAAGESYWYCWGSFHAVGHTPTNPSGYLGQKAGDLALASCLVLPNKDSHIVAAARGTIFTYGVDGVCHQLANQVLYATGVGGRPMTVSGARGYVASNFIYGTYGLQHAAWAAKIASCGGAAAPVAGPSGPSGMTTLSDTPNTPDEFEEQAQSALKGEPQLLAQLLSLRADVRNFSLQRFPGAVAPSAETLNARNQHMLDEAARLLGPNKFKEIFGYPPTEKLNLVDPTVTGSNLPPVLKAN